MFLFSTIIVLLIGSLVTNALDYINECTRQEWHTETQLIPHSYTHTKSRRTWCFKIPFRCEVTETETFWRNKTESVNVLKNVTECCVGYGRKKNGTCLPICENECKHGRCVSPDRCLCDEGWTSHDCSQECEPGRYGIDCSEYCYCENDATCNILNGTCYCADGYTGFYCESACPQGSYGKNCENTCHCKNGAVCEAEKGDCTCLPGYIGKHCENKCPEGTFGDGCKTNCSCNQNNTEICSHLDGVCSCFPGFYGENCGKVCQFGFWGSRCENKCECDLNATCNPSSGECICPSGWQGPKCSEQCPFNQWGKDCAQNCECVNNSTCISETGACRCFPGWLGIDCSIPCPEGLYGSYCNFSCECRNNGTCDPVDGSCECQPGWNGDRCSKAALFSSENTYSYIPIIVYVLSTVGGFLLCGALFFNLIRKQKLNSRENILEENNSISSVLPSETSPKFSIRCFMNPAYGETKDQNPSTFVKTTAYITPIVSSTENDANKDQCENSTSKLSETSCEKRLSPHFSVGYSVSKSGEESNALDEKSDKVSLYKISIYDEKEDHIYANADDVKDLTKNATEN